jgi:hypothetical protein
MQPTVDPQPENQTPVSSPEQTPVNSNMPPSQPVTPVTPLAAPPRKKNLLGLWIGIGVVVVLIAAALVTFFVSKANADSVADAYRRDAAQYVDNVSHRINDSDDPSQAKSDLDALKQPELKSAFLSFTSSKYGDATKLEDALNGEVASINDKLALYAGVADFRNAFDKKYDELVSAETMIYAGTDSAVANAFNQMSVTINELADMVRDANLPNELQSNQTKLEQVYRDMSVAAKDLADAYVNQDLDAYSTALNKVEVLSSQEEAAAALGGIKDYYNDLSSKQTALVKEIDTFKQNNGL